MFTLADLVDADAAAAIGALGLDDPAGARLEPVAYPTGSPATAALYRVRGPRGSLFCKVLQHVRHWPGVHRMPPDIAAVFADELPWRAELDLWEPWQVATMPAGMRPPVLHALVEMADERAAVWMEDVDEAATPWDLPRYERAAHLLGRWNARATDPDLRARCPYPDPNHALRMYVGNAVRFRGLQPLADDGLWSHPWLAHHRDLRADLRALATEIPAMLERLDSFAQCVPHGDASPQNLLVRRDEQDAFVAIDVSFRTPHALGFDLGQLLVGLTHAGEVPAARLPEIAGVIVPAYLAGLHAEGLLDRDGEVRDAFATGVMLRSGFDGLLLDSIGDADHRGAFDERVAMTRVLVELYRSR